MATCICFLVDIKLWFILFFYVVEKAYLSQKGKITSLS